MEAHIAIVHHSNGIDVLYCGNQYRKAVIALYEYVQRWIEDVIDAVDEDGAVKTWLKENENEEYILTDPAEMTEEDMLEVCCEYFSVHHEMESGVVESTRFEEE